jgi:hypothetical protein
VNKATPTYQLLWLIVGDLAHDTVEDLFGEGENDAAPDTKVITAALFAVLHDIAGMTPDEIADYVTRWQENNRPPGRR